MKASVLLTVLLALSGCGPQAPADEPPTGVSASADPAAPSASPPAPTVSGGAIEATIALPGEYRVAGVRDAGIDHPYAITASITADRIHVTADCLNFAWRYTVQGANIATERVAVEGCARGLTAAEEAVVAAFDAATVAMRTPANAIELSGGRHSVTLFSQ